MAAVDAWLKKRKLVRCSVCSVRPTRKLWLIWETALDLWRCLQCHEEELLPDGDE